MLAKSFGSTSHAAWGSTRSEWLARCLYEVSQILVTSKAPNALAAALDALCALLELRAAGLTLVDADGLVVDELTCSPHGSTPGLTAWSQAVVQRVLRERMPAVVENAWLELGGGEATTRDSPEGDVETSIVGVPLAAGEQGRGALVILRQHSPGDQAEFPFDSDVRLLSSVARLMALSWQLAGLGTERLRRQPASSVEPETGALGQAVCWRAALRTAQTAARTNATVLLRGETGSGKNVLARLVHEASPRHDKPFVAVNCAALPESLLESELFGHERGAFTGAVGQRKGRFELAHEGTLFLDEIGELSPSFQAKLLRVLQQGELERVGGSQTIRVDVRIIAATHRDLEAAVRSGAFRADLYYRLCVVPVRVPPLRERPEDIALLARWFLERFNAENGTERTLDDTALRALVTHPFPGNVRELENAVRRAATLGVRRRLNAADFAFLAETSRLGATERPDSLPGEPDAEHEPPPAAERSLAPPHELRRASRERVVEALERSGWVLAKAGRLLGLTPRQVAYAVQKHGITLRKL